MRSSGLAVSTITYPGRSSCSTSSHSPWNFFCVWYLGVKHSPTRPLGATRSMSSHMARSRPVWTCTTYHVTFDVAILGTPSMPRAPPLAPSLGKRPIRPPGTSGVLHQTRSTSEQDMLDQAWAFSLGLAPSAGTK